MTDIPQQLALPLGASEESVIDTVLSIARNAVDLERHPGYAAFTDGKVTIDRADDERIILSTDNPWACNAIRTRLLAAGCAVEGDPAHEKTTVTVWPTAQRDDAELPEAAPTEERDQHGQLTVVLNGPHGTVEQQIGSGGHNDLIAHAQHPFPGAVRTTLCVRHGDCWMRSQWPRGAEPRRHIRSVITDTGYGWDVTPEAGQAMQNVYLRHIHQTRPGDTPPAYRVALPAQPVPGAVASKSSASVPVVSAPRLVDAIRDLADYEPIA